MTAFMHCRVRQLALLALLLSSCVCSAYASAAQLSSTVPSQRLSLGPNFVLVWENSNGSSSASATGQAIESPTLRLQVQSASGRVLWSSLNAQPFLSAATGRDTLVQEGANFQITQSNVNLCTEQTVESVAKDPAGQSVAVSGTLGPASANCSQSFSLVFALLSEQGLSQHLTFRAALTPTAPSSTQDRVFLTMASAADERVFGLGQQYTFWNLKGKLVPIITREQGIGRGDQPITDILNASGGSGGNAFTQYAAVPHFVTSSNTSLLVENYEYSVFDLTQPDRIVVEVLNTTVIGRVLLGNSPLELISQYTLYCGRMQPLPQWIHSGAVVGLQGGQERVLSIFRQLQAANTSVAALWLQDWSGTRNQTVLGNVQKRLWWNWEVDVTLYPNWAGMISELRGAGSRVMSYINPFLVDVSLKPNYTTNYFKIAASLGYFVKNASGEPYLISSGPDFLAGQIDLTNTAAREWYKTIIKQNMIDPGVSGWMADFGEYLQFDAALASGISAASFHNQYPQEWAKLNNEAVHERGKDGDVVFFSRSGSAHSPNFTKLFWLGDQLPSWDEFDGLKTAVLGMLTSGVSGYSLQHSDIGGYTTISYLGIVKYVRSKELLYRWSEMSAFTAVFRTHEGSIPDLNAQVYTDAETLAYFSAFSNIYASLINYRLALVNESTQLGYPVVRHPILHFPADPNVFDLKYQFMLGPVIMVAPVTDAGAANVTLYLPAGSWQSIHTLATVVSRGQRIVVDAPVGCPAAFILKSTERPGSSAYLSLLDSFMDTVPRVLQSCSSVQWQFVA